MDLVSVLSLVALWIRVVWCRPSVFCFEASGIFLEAEYASCGTPVESDDYDRLKFLQIEVE